MNKRNLSLVRQDEWDPLEIFKDIWMEPKSALWERLWKDTYAEYDARLLEKYLTQMNIIRTCEGEAFLQAWSFDERRHTLGFVRILEIVCHNSQKNSWELLNEREGEFSKIEPLLKNEFSALLVIAFDEIVTCRAYALDKQFYSNLGKPFELWLRNLIKDEASHFLNAMNVIRYNFSDSIQKAESVLIPLIEVKNQKEYNNTFVLDYFGDDYSKALLLSCKNTVLRCLHRK